MKKLLALLLVLTMAASFVACGKEEPKDDEKAPVENVLTETDKNDETVTEDKKEDEKPSEGKKPAENKPAEDKKPEESKKPEAKPQEKPEEKPAEKPAEKPQEDAKTVGQKLVSEFNKKASSGTPLSIAESIANGGSLPFMAGAMEVEEGLLSGFDNFEVKGFKSGAVFMPMIGSIPFIGYVFEVSDGVSASEFAASLKANANKRWNICVEADEVVTSVVGNKVFFVMCPKEFEE